MNSNVKDGILTKIYKEYTGLWDSDDAKKMQDYCVREMKKDGINTLFAWLATCGIPKLERWQKEL